jgi:hypothetical protein
MRFHVVGFMIAFAIHLPGLGSPNHVPRDIQAFVENAEACEHFGGEYDPEASAERKKEVERGIRKSCGDASRQLPRLRAKYRHDPARLEIIERNANEAVTNYRR